MWYNLNTFVDAYVDMISLAKKEITKTWPSDIREKANSYVDAQAAFAKDYAKLSGDFNQKLGAMTTKFFQSQES